MDTQEAPPGLEDVLVVVRAPDEKQADETLAHAEEQLTTITTRHEKPEATHIAATFIRDSQR